MLFLFLKGSRSGLVASSLVACFVVWPLFLEGSVGFYLAVLVLTSVGLGMLVGLSVAMDFPLGLWRLALLVA